ncbi:MAG: hypothetical protein JSU94_09915 [Phycisphaerales bacterium]|nr:MAG: hypothetical protein JSU94_09915 [Phycisphaerales bacterium]
MNKALRPASIIAAVILGLSAACFAAQIRASLAPTHVEVEPIGTAPQAKFENLVTFCMDRDGNLLACDAGASRIVKLDPDGKRLATWKLDFAPWAIHACPEGIVYVAGPAVVAKLDASGKVLKKVESDGGNFPDGRPSGITATDKDVFLNVGFGWSLRSVSSIARFDRDLGSPATIVENLRGCCQRLDIVSKDEQLYVAENSRYRVLKCDREGRVLAKWGRRHRTDIAGFGSCCNPMNLCFGPEGELYTAESGLGRIKRYTPDGRFLGLVGYVGVERFNTAGRLAASCSNIALAVNKDASRIYVLDFKNNIIRVLARSAGPDTRLDAR